MILSYTDIMDGKTHRIKAEVTTDHCASHYGQPVIVLPDGGALDMQSWILLKYTVIKAAQKEMELLRKVFDNFNFMMGDKASHE